jgi:hypothetical protein
MPADYSRIWPLLIAVLALLLIYRRVRRSFGIQPVRPWRMGLRMVLLIAVGASLIAVGSRTTAMLLLEIAGAAAGVALALWNAHRTRYVRHDGRIHYVPHSYAGIAVSLLVLGRIVYRSLQAYSMGGLGAAAGPAGSSAGAASLAVMQSPATVGLLFVLIGYHLCYYSRVLWKSKHIAAQDAEVAASSATVPS